MPTRMALSAALGIAALLAGTTGVPAALALAPPAARQEAVLFTDDFERGLDAWDLLGVDSARLVPSGDPAHGRVLELTPNGDDAAAIVKDSSTWGRVRFEGDMRFVSEMDSYLGLLYNHVAHGSRRDFGLIYVKGDGSYLQVNPHRDLNVSRLVYPELHVDLTGASAVTVGEWKRFAVEVDGNTAHVYIGSTTTPQVTFSALELDQGALGLQPRSVGGPVWVDNIRVRAIDRLSYDGPPLPNPAYKPDAFLTGWQVAGPLPHTDDELARQPGRRPEGWRPFATDARGAVVTGRVVDYHGPNTVAYFRTTVQAESPRSTELHLSTADDFAVWLNGAFLGFGSRQDAAWFDFPANPEHRPRRVRLDLVPGANDIVIRVRGGVYASGGFFAALTEVSR